MRQSIVSSRKIFDRLKKKNLTFEALPIHFVHLWVKSEFLNVLKNNEFEFENSFE